MALFSNISYYLISLINTLLAFILLFILIPETMNSRNIVISIISSIVFTGSDIIKNGTSLILITIAIFYILRRSHRKKSFKLSIYLLIILITISTQSIASYIVFNLFKLTPHPTFIKSIFISLLISLLNWILAIGLVLIIRYLINKFYISDELIQWIILLSLTIITASYIGLVLTSRYLKVQLTYLKLTTAILFLIIAFITIGASFFIYGHIKKIQADAELKTIENTNLYIKELERKNEDLRGLKHDYKNLLLSLEATIKDDNNTEAIKKINAYTSTNSVNTKIEDSGLYSIDDELIRGIIVTKLVTAKNKNIETHFEIADSVNFANSNSVEITRILGILFDNAIEATIKSEKPILDFALISYDDSIEFIIKNSVSPNQKIDINNIYTSGFSTKKNHSGLGLANIKRIVDSNSNYYLNTSFKNGIFEVILTILEVK